MVDTTAVTVGPLAAVTVPLAAVTVARLAAGTVAPLAAGTAAARPAAVRSALTAALLRPHWKCGLLAIRVCCAALRLLLVLTSLRGLPQPG